MNNPHRLAASLCAALPAAIAAAGPSYEFIDLSADFNPALFFRAAAFNQNSQVAGNMRSTPGGLFDTAVRHHPDGSTQTLTMANHSLDVVNISEAGLVLGTIRENIPDAPTNPFIWNPSNGQLDELSPRTPFYPSAINDSLLVTGLTQDQISGLVFNAVTDQETIIALDKPPRRGVGTQGAKAVNNLGVVAGQEVLFIPNLGAFYERPYRWTQTDGPSILPLGRQLVAGRAVDINENGDITGTGTDLDFGFKPTIWPAGGGDPIVINPPFGYFVADAVVINESRQIGVIAPNDLFGFTRAFIWDGGQYIDLTEHLPKDAPGQAARILGLNDNGAALVELTSDLFITGYGILSPKPSGPPADLNGDGLVDGIDLGILLSQWLTAGSADLNDDNVVNGIDLGILLASWSS